jgi:hypothetical protein
LDREKIDAIKWLLGDICLFSQGASDIRLRSYQREAARAIVRSVILGQGLSLVILFPRQSGKNELQAQIETYLLTLYSQMDAEIIKISPTWKPQSQNAMRRLEKVLKCNLLIRGLWRKESGHIYRVGKARIVFLSGGKAANIVGATASTLLEVDEAQDILISKYDKEIAPMAASTNATRVFYGTAWTSQTLLARELRAAREAEKVDGLRRVFVVNADEVIREAPEYGNFVREQVARMGRNHPMVRSQFFCEEIDAEGGMFPARRQALMRGTHPAVERPSGIGKLYAFLLDVAGEDEGVKKVGEDAALENPERDATALTVVEVSPAGEQGEPGLGPIYRCVQRYQWVGEKHTQLLEQLKALGGLWQPREWVVDATGVGAGLASFLVNAFPGRVTPFVFTLVSKSKLGWDFLALVEAGRYQDWAAASDARAERLAEEFWRQVEFCQFEILPGSQKNMRWGVPDGTRDPANGKLLHDDLLISAALCSRLGSINWNLSGPELVVRRADPLDEMDREF